MSRMIILKPVALRCEISTQETAKAFKDVYRKNLFLFTSFAKSIHSTKNSWRVSRVRKGLNVPSGSRILEMTDDL